MAKELVSLDWVEELLPQGVLRKRMFGGFAYYSEEKLVLVIFESEGHKTYKGKTYPFEIWNGCMFPAEKSSHADILTQYPILVHHPVLPKWLYLPMETEDFESHVQTLLSAIRAKSPLFGSIPKSKSTQPKRSKKVEEKIGKFVPRKPQMFRDEPIENTLSKATKISDLKNLGQESEKTFLSVGIKTPQQVVKLGWKKVMEKLYRANPKHGHSIYAYAVIGAIQGKIWNGISEDEKREAREFMKSLKAKGSKSSVKKSSKRRKKAKSSAK